MWCSIEAKTLGAYMFLGQEDQFILVIFLELMFMWGLEGKQAVGATAYAKAWRLQRSWHNRRGKRNSVNLTGIYLAHLHILILFCTCVDSEYNSLVTDHFG